MIEKFGDEIWLIDGPVVAGWAGFRFPTRMAVIRLGDGGLFVWSPVAICPEIKGFLDTFGPVRNIVAPNSLHNVFVARWQAEFPDAQVWGAPGIERRQPGLRPDAELSDSPPPEWEVEIDQVMLSGNLITTEIVFFHRQSGTAIFTDMLQNFPKGWFTGWRGVVARFNRLRGQEPAVPATFRSAFVRRGPARGAVAKILEWPVQQVVMAHGVPVTEDAGGFLARSFRWSTG